MKRHDGEPGQTGSRFLTEEEPERPGLKVLTAEDLRNMNIPNPVYGPPPCFKDEESAASAPADPDKTEEFNPEDNIVEDLYGPPPFLKGKF